MLFSCSFFIGLVFSYVVSLFLGRFFLSVFVYSGFGEKIVERERREIEFYILGEGMYMFFREVNIKRR